jgi:hypothetical protein
MPGRVWFSVGVHLRGAIFNPLNPKLVYIIFKHSVRTAYKTQHFRNIKVNWLMLFKEIIAVHGENRMNPTCKKRRITDVTAGGTTGL